MGRRAHVWGLVCPAIVALGCAHPPPPPKPPPPPPPPVAIIEAPPPPPKCESIDEACEAKPGETARIQASGWRLEPPPGWKYAQEDGATVALSQEAALAVVIYDPAEPKQDVARRDEVTASITSRLGIALKTKKLAWPKKPDNVITVGALKVALYQFDAAARATKKGPLLVFSAKLPDGKNLLGGGFVPDDDTTNADKAILKSIGSIASPATADSAP